MRVSIRGGGVIGAATAYSLSRRGVQIIVIERTGLACAASGKSGGFLALDWCDGTPIEALARRSFALHACLPDEIGGDWGYRRVSTYSGFSSHRGEAHGRARAPSGDWTADSVAIHQQLGSPDTTAQVHPARLTRALMDAAQANGAELRFGQVTGVLCDESGKQVRGIDIDGEELPGDAIVIAMGPWSSLASAWLPLPAVFGLKGHSIVCKTGTQVPAEALFLEHEEAGSVTSSPEVFPRGDGTTYVCALSSDAPLPRDPAEVQPDPGAAERLQRICGQLSPVLSRSPILARQACYRPMTHDGLPLIGPVPGLQGAYVATGHSVWGILNAPATGKAMAELIIDGASRAIDLSHFSPGRLAPARSVRQ